MGVGGMLIGTLGLEGSVGSKQTWVDEVRGWWNCRI